METIVTCPLCETQETIFINGTFGFVTCLTCNHEFEVDLYNLDYSPENQPETETK